MAVLVALALGPTAQAAAIEVSPSQVYAQALRIEQETELLKRHFKVTGKIDPPEIRADLKPRHSWAKTYLILIKISTFRRQHGLMFVEPAYLEPSGEIDPSYTWEQTQRILAEIAILRHQLGIPGQAAAAPQVSGKQPIDVYNKLHQISQDWSLLLGGHMNPSQVYGEAMRLNEDVNAIIHFGHFVDNAQAPRKNPNGTPTDSLRVAFEVLAEVQRIQRQLDIPVVDLSVFRKDKDAVPEDVFNLVGLILAEVQTIKAKLGMSHNVTPGASWVEDKTPADVAQLLGYMRSKFKVIQKL